MAQSKRGRLVRRLRRALPLLFIALSGVIVGVAIKVADPGPLRQVRNIVFDEFQRLNPRSFDAEMPVRVLAIDDESLARHGQWPWPRHKIGELTNRLTEMGAAAIGFDILWAEPDRMSPEFVAELLPQGPDRSALIAQLQKTPRSDDVLAEALMNSPSVVGTVLRSTSRPGLEDTTAATAEFAEAKAGFAFAGDDPRPFVPQFPAESPPLPVLAQSAAGIGALNWLADRDQVVRDVPLVLLKEDGSFVPGLVAEALRVAQGASSFVIRASNASGNTAFGAQTGINAVRIGAFTVPTTPSGAVKVHFSPMTAQRYIPAWWVLEGVVDPAEVEGRIILMGATAPGLLDVRATPIDAAIPGVDIHAQLIEHIVSGAELVRPDWALGLEIVVFAAVVLIFAIAAAWLSPLNSLAFGVLTLGGLFYGSYRLFTDYGLLVDPSFVTIASGLVLLATTGWVAADQASQRRWVRSAFGRYVAPDLVGNLANNPDRLALGGEIRPMTLLFTDMRNFTTISEGMDAQSLTTFINDFLTPLTDTILEARGTIDKYMGDAIMAFWNAPLDDPKHAAHGCEAALNMLITLEKFNTDNEARYPKTAIGIGLNTGECCVGNLGSNQRFDYSVVGDDVNIASRLEGQTKTYGLSILTGPRTTEEAAAEGYIFVPVDTVKVKGKDIAIDLSCLVGGPNHPVAPALDTVRPVVSEMVEAYRADDLDTARAALAQLAEAGVPELQGMVALYQKRLASTVAEAVAAAAE
ncbi:MAG: adenylate/guanylate cyclase domain-containing protein [Pseudomonadota bacterium]